MTKVGNENILSDERIEARRTQLNTCLNLAVDWICLLVAGPAEQMAPDMVVVPTDAIRKAMVERIGEELTAEHFVGCMAHIQEDIMIAYLEPDKKITLCSAWDWGHSLYHLLYPAEA